MDVRAFLSVIGYPRVHEVFFPLPIAHECTYPYRETITLLLPVNIVRGDICLPFEALLPAVDGNALVPNSSLRPIRFLYDKYRLNSHHSDCIADFTTVGRRQKFAAERSIQHFFE